jgi:hypothetical protein
VASPWAVTLPGGNRNDVKQLLPLLRVLHARPVAGEVGRPRQKPVASGQEMVL